jgi:hypothetical protein
MTASVHRCAAILLSAAALWSSAASCSPKRNPTQAAPTDPKAMLAKVVARVKSGDRAQAFFDFTARRAPYFEENAYVVCVDARDIVVAHGGFPTYVGAGSFFKDVNGRLMAPVVRDAAIKGDGTLRYTMQDEETNNAVEHKIGIFTRIGDDVCGVVTPDRNAREARNARVDGSPARDGQ